MDWVDFADRVWKQIVRNPEAVKTDAEKWLKVQKDLLSRVPLVEEFQDPLHGTVLLSEMDELGIQLDDPKLPCFDVARRISKFSDTAKSRYRFSKFAEHINS